MGTEVVGLWTSSAFFVPKFKLNRVLLKLSRTGIYKIKLHGFHHRLAEDMFVNPSMILLEEMDQICMAGNFPPLMRRFLPSLTSCSTG